MLFFVCLFSTFLKISSLSGLIEDCLIFYIWFGIQILAYVVLAKVYKENLTSRIQVVGKGRSLLIAFSGNCGYSSLILNQYSTNGSFLKVACNVSSEIISRKFLYCIAVKCTGLSYSLNKFFIHDFIMFHIGNLENIGSANYAGLQNVGIFHYTKFLKSH